MAAITFQHNDGGREKAGFKGTAGDCVARSVSIASGIPYAEVYAALAEGNKRERKTKKSKGSGKKTAREGIHVTRKWFKDYMKSIGFEWTATMKIGSGCQVHLKAGELPSGRLVVAVSNHYTAVVDGVINDLHDPSRNGTRCVYGYYRKIEDISSGTKIVNKKAENHWKELRKFVGKNARVWKWNLPPLFYAIITQADKTKEEYSIKVVFSEPTDLEPAISLDEAKSAAEAFVAKQIEFMQQSLEKLNKK